MYDITPVIPPRVHGWSTSHSMEPPNFLRPLSSWLDLLSPRPRREGIHTMIGLSSPLFFYISCFSVRSYASPLPSSLVISSHFGCFSFFFVALTNVAPNPHTHHPLNPVHQRQWVPFSFVSSSSRYSRLSPSSLPIIPTISRGLLPTAFIS